MATTSVFATVEEAIEEIRQAPVVVIVDDPDRENEGDLGRDRRWRSRCPFETSTNNSTSFETPHWPRRSSRTGRRATSTPCR
jgi:hypothetical protein